MNEQTQNMHSLLQMLQTIEAGLVVLDRNNQVQVWNSFMENHSGIRVSKARGSNLFELFPELPERWLQRKIDFVFGLKSRAYSTWEQRPHLFDFSSVRPLTGNTTLMYQNLTINPLLGPDGEVAQVCMLIYDVTDTAMSKLALRSANQALEHLSQTDKLTGLFNRGHWEECLIQEFQRLKRYSGDASLLLFDIDHFKAVNDNYGHDVGDEVLRQMANLIRANLRETDIAGRFGGEEFAILLPNTQAEAAMQLAERLRQKVREYPMQHTQGNFQVTVSLGVADFDSDQTSHQEWLKHADNALYEAKNAGRDQAILFKK
ncbi:GGDEF domain-containing protein [Aliidiomarina soli]|uniref:diguanylate cyclase n=1 Tax=Aliidiomarina soli TaxID=1928574 RepID=A0A432WDC8_9GAMM|nr:diguanylate cyclase [Aliidiomarina soli]RUO30393.1 diguanylate cyclase [Aliidiomarina soli]